MKKMISAIAALAVAATCVFAVLPSSAAEPVENVPSTNDMHSYLVGTQSAYTMEDVADNGGVKFSKTSPTGYENLGTSYGIKTYKYDGLRLEFTDILLTKGDGGATPRLSIMLTPNTDGAIPRESGNKGLIFTPAPDWFGNHTLYVTLGAIAEDVEGWTQKGANELRPFAVSAEKAPFALLNATDAPATYSFELYKNPDNADEYIICIDDCAWYKIPAKVVDQALSTEAVEGANFIYKDLPAGNCVIGFTPWIPGGSYEFTWSKVINNPAKAATTETSAVPSTNDMHSYLVGTQSAYAMEDVADNGGVKFSKTSPTGYENLGTSYGIKTYKYDGLRLEFTDILLTKGDGGATPRLSIMLTPNTDGAIPRESGNKGLIFTPAPDWFGNHTLYVTLGAIAEDVEGWTQKGANELRPFAVSAEKAPFALLNATDAPATYSFELYKNPDNADEYIICIDDCAWYKIPAKVVDQALSTEAVEGANFIYKDLPAGNCVIGFTPWIPGGSYEFTWSKVINKAPATPDDGGDLPPEGGENPPAGGEGEGGGENPPPEGGEGDEGEDTPSVPTDPTLPYAGLLHPYFASTGGFTLTDVEGGIRINKDSNLTGYEFIGTDYGVRNYKIDGLRLEFDSINMVSKDDTPATSPRLGVGFTPYTDGKTTNADPYSIKGVLFIPATGFFGSNDLIVYLGAMAEYPGEDGEWAAGINIIEPYHVNEGAEPFGYMFGTADDFTIQFNKQGDEYIICINDGVYYKIPAVLIDYAISTDTTGLVESAAQFIKADLAEGYGIMNFYPWTAGASFDFTWTSVEEDMTFVSPVIPDDDDENGDNTGDDNTGDDNTGDDNTGDDNTGDDNTGNDDESPDTGDMTGSGMALAVAAVASTGAILAIRRRKNR